MGIPESMMATRVRIIGASNSAIRRVRSMAPAGVDVVDEPIAEPDWIVVATGGQRIEAIASSGLPPFRVVEVPTIAGDLDAPDAAALRAALVTDGGNRCVASRGVAVGRAARGPDRPQTLRMSRLPYRDASRRRSY